MHVCHYTIQRHDVTLRDVVSQKLQLMVDNTYICIYMFDDVMYASIVTPAFSRRRLRVSPGVQRRRLLGRRREELPALRKLRQQRPVRVELLQHPRSLRRRLPQLRQVPPRV